MTPAMSQVPYAWVCAACEHMVTKHGLHKTAETVHGPYVCPCGCQIYQDSPTVGLTRAQLDRARK